MKFESGARKVLAEPMLMDKGVQEMGRMMREPYQDFEHRMSIERSELGLAIRQGKFDRAACIAQHILNEIESHRHD